MQSNHAGLDALDRYVIQTRKRTPLNLLRAETSLPLSDNQTRASPFRGVSKCRSIPGCLITLADPCGPSPTEFLRSRFEPLPISPTGFQRWFGHQLSFVRAPFIDKGSIAGHRAFVCRLPPGDPCCSFGFHLPTSSQGLLLPRRCSELSNLTRPMHIKTQTIERRIHKTLRPSCCSYPLCCSPA